MNARPHRGALIASGTLIGAGLGGFLDGIVFHQILQWHNMLSSRYAPVTLVAVKYNMLWDGLFHAFTWVMTAAGLAILWRWQSRSPTAWSSRTLAGALALGWGLFNLIEGFIDHHLLGVHHVHPGSNQVAWDVGFLIFGAALATVGWTLIRSGHRAPNQTPKGTRLGPSSSPDAVRR